MPDVDYGISSVLESRSPAVGILQSGARGPAHRMALSGARLASLDGVRGLAIISVIAFHALRLHGRVEGWLRLWRGIQESSWAGVDLFFVLSGFLITGVLLDSCQDKGYFRNFYARRALRIMPLYYAVLTLALVVIPALAGSRLPALYSRLTENQFWLWTYLQNYLQSKGPHQLPGLGHFWSLAVEEQFYWFWPIIVYFTSRRGLLRMCVAICVAEPILRIACLHFGLSEWAVRELSFARMDTLLYGAIAALLLREPTWFTARRYWVPVLIAISVAALAWIAFHKGFIPYEAPETVVIGYSALGILFAAFVYACASNRTSIGSLMSVSILRWFGRYSYAEYVFHPPLLLVYEATIAPHVGLGRVVSTTICFLSVTAVSSGMAWISWIVFESRFLKLKRYFEYGGQERRHAAAAPEANAAPLSNPNLGSRLWGVRKERFRRQERIFLHTPEPFSSAALYVAALARSVTGEGTPIHIVCPSNHQCLEQFNHNPLITVHPTMARSTDSRRGFLGKVVVNVQFLLSSLAVLFCEIRRGDLVHFQYSLHLPFGALFFLCARVRGCKIVYTAHDPLPHKWMMPKELRWVERRALAWMYRVSDTIIVHNEVGKRTIVEQFGESSAKVKVIPQGPYELGAGTLPIPESEYLEVLLFGALRENKGAHLAIEAIQQLYREEVPIRLTIAGAVLNRNEHKYWDRCQELIRKYPQPIRLIDGFIPDEQLPELFASCHCFLLPYTEFFSDSGVASIALANGRPVIGTRAGGLGALLEASNGGLVIEEASVDAVVTALRKAILLSRQQLDQFGREGQAWILSECGWPKIARETLQVYAARQLAAPNATAITPIPYPGRATS
ncbi:MAG: acyltransferase family protein [Acidobacteria bacterium]|nr:acyltransferase family protein [Acidobacteriota bacterium]